MATSTYEPITTTTLTGTQSVVSFTSIPDTYTDLYIIVQAKGTDNAFRNIFAKPNNDGGSNYARTVMYGIGSGSGGSVRVGSNSSGLYIGDASPSSGNFVNLSRATIFNYANNTTYKICMHREDSANQAATTGVSSWFKTPEKITSLYLSLNIGDFASGSVFTIYGIKAE